MGRRRARRSAPASIAAPPASAPCYARGVVGRASLGLGLGLLIACGGAPNREPEGWDDELRLASPIDRNPDPHVLEIDLVARPETLPIWSLTPPTPVYTYDGGLPGPLLELSVGDRLIVHFRNELPEPTTIHWHGLRIDAAMDGAPDHPHPPVPPGGTFDYDFVVPDAGLFWYHPHVRSAAQVGAGLYGPILVRPADGSEDAAPPDELVLVLSDIHILDDGSLGDPNSGGDFGTLFGREGNVVLTNGRWLPTIRVRSGITQRWRLVNAARSRYFQLELEGTSFRRIGGDGGLLPEAIDASRLLLIPGQRADVLVTPSDAAGSIQFLRWIPFDRGLGSAELRAPELVLRLEFVDEAGEPVAPTLTRTIAPIDVAGATPVELRLTEMKDAEGHPLLGINGVPFGEGEPFPATVGETQVWTIDNQTDWSHPFHLHGFFFQEIDEDGAAVEPIAWLDSIDVPAHELRRIAVHFDARPGMWMFHCHILDHAEAGMMAMVDLREPP
ncbi:MAG: multicopper oxidase family protein [Myxococcales bacterium]|nr:multicopper oxidase family protein [Myxococcales bacterium]